MFGVRQPSNLRTPEPPNIFYAITFCSAYKGKFSIYALISLRVAMMSPSFLTSERMVSIQSITFKQSASWKPRVVMAPAQSDPRSHHGRLGIEGHHIFVHGDVGAYQGVFSISTRYIFRAQVQQHQVIVGSARDYFVASLYKSISHNFGVLSLVGRRL